MTRTTTLKRKIIFSMLVFLATLSVFMISCGQPTGNSAVQSESQESPKNDAEVVEPGSEPPKELKKATMAISVNTLSHAPIFIADLLGYYEEEGVDLDIVFIDGAGVIQSLVGGTSQFGATDSGATTRGHEKNIDLIAVQANVNKLTMDFIMSNSAIEKTGLNLDSPIEERFAALKGLTIGITTPGSATDVFSRFYINQAGLEVDKDVNLLAIGGAPSLAAAIKQGTIDAFMLSPPQPQIVEAEGAGKIFISASLGDVPGLDNFPYEVINVMKSYAEENPEVVRGVARAVSRANNLMLDNKEEALEVLQRHFDKVEPEILRIATESVTNAVPRDGLMDESGWKNAIMVHKMSGMIERDLDATEGVFWTNEFLR